VNLYFLFVYIERNGDESPKDYLQLLLALQGKKKELFSA
jgi:hypothetical protein